MKKLYVLVGVPGSGKSTWVSNQDWASNCSIVSSDRFIDQEAARLGKTYNDIFDDYIKIATKLMENQALIAAANNKDVIWDQTNTTVKGRKKKLEMMSDYYPIAVVFKTPESAELATRLASRPGKNIPDHVMKSMIDGLTIPTEEEGFKEIWFVS